jgi:hypothetical protein
VAAAPRHSLLAVRIPRPQRKGETADIVFARPVRLRAGGPAGAGLPGAALQLEDARPADKSAVMPRTASDFFHKVLKAGAEKGSAGALGIGAVNVSGLLTNAAGGPGGSASTASGAGGSSYSSFYAETAGNEGGAAAASTALIVPSEAGTAAAVAAAVAAEGDTGEGYDPLEGRTKGLGKVFLEFNSLQGALAAQQELSGRAFNGRILITAFAPEGPYSRGELVDWATCLD